mmetsp:Transcript_16228/g.35511  ORF Transcript_16228/g.35511 Transcript_16228/m.35511 type:complete len:265 (+) Transcript_16228:69-863(+)
MKAEAQLPPGTPGAIASQQRASDPVWRILAKLEETQDRMTEKAVRRGVLREDLAEIEQRASSAWAAPKQMSRSSTSPAGLTAGDWEPRGRESTPSAMGARSTPSAATVGVGSLARAGQSLGRRSSRLRPERSFGIAERMPIHHVVESKVGPGSYNTQEIGSFLWQRDEVSHPAQQKLSNHKSSVLVSFGHKKTNQALPAAPLLSESPGPGHYMTPDYWDNSWQRYPPAGPSFSRQLPKQGDSRFGGLARGMERSDSGGVDLLTG